MLSLKLLKFMTRDALFLTAFQQKMVVSFLFVCCVSGPLSMLYVSSYNMKTHTFDNNSLMNSPLEILHVIWQQNKVCCILVCALLGPNMACDRLL